MTIEAGIKKYPVHRKALVVGGGLAGAAAAYAIAAGGAPVVLVDAVERLPVLDARETWPPAAHQARPREADKPADPETASSVLEFAASLGERLQAHPLIEVRTSTVLSSVTGHVGDFLVTLVQCRDREEAAGVPHTIETARSRSRSRLGPETEPVPNSPSSGKSTESPKQAEKPDAAGETVRQELKVGAIVVAVDAARSAAQTFLKIHNGRNALTLSEFNRSFKPFASHRQEMLNVGGRAPRSVAFLLAPLPLSSRDPTARALQTAILLRQRAGCEVSVFFSSLQVAGNGLAERYREARGAGVLFMPYVQPPVVEVSDADVKIRHEDIFTPEKATPGEWRYDVVVLDEISAPSPALAQIAAALGVRADSPDFGMPVNPTLLPVDSSRKGVFVIGGSRGDVAVEDCMIEASAAGAGVLSILSRKELEAEVRAVVDPAKCALCLTCVRVCPHVAIDYTRYPDYNRSAARICDAACMGCGICASECPARAIEMTGTPSKEGTGEVLLLCCRKSAEMAHAAVLARRVSIPAQVRIREIPCAGSVGVEDILHALQSGFAKILVLGCHQDACRSLYGNSAAQKRIDFVKKFLEKLGIPGERVGFSRLAAPQVGRFMDVSR